MRRHLLNSLTLISLLLCIAVAAAALWALGHSAKVLFYVPYADGAFISSYHSQLCLVKGGSLVARDHGLSLPVVLVPFALLSFLWLKQARRVARDRRAARGACPSCGYDLRATPGRCPECGANDEESVKGAVRE